LSKIGILNLQGCKQYKTKNTEFYNLIIANTKKSRKNKEIKEIKEGKECYFNLGALIENTNIYVCTS
jgi:hypothetical protein